MKNLTIAVRTAESKNVNHVVVEAARKVTASYVKGGVELEKATFNLGKVLNRVKTNSMDDVALAAVISAAKDYLADFYAARKEEALKRAEAKEAEARKIAEAAEKAKAEAEKQAEAEAKKAMDEEAEEAMEARLAKVAENFETMDTLIYGIEKAEAKAVALDAQLAEAEKEAKVVSRNYLPNNLKVYSLRQQVKDNAFQINSLKAELARTEAAQYELTSGIITVTDEDDAYIINRFNAYFENLQVELEKMAQAEADKKARSAIYAAEKAQAKAEKAAKAEADAKAKAEAEAKAERDARQAKIDKAREDRYLAERDVIEAARKARFIARNKRAKEKAEAMAVHEENAKRFFEGIFEAAKKEDSGKGTSRRRKSIAVACVLFGKETQAAVAERFEVSPSTISRWCKEYKQGEWALTDETRKLFSESVPKGLNFAKSKINRKKEAVRLRNMVIKARANMLDKERLLANSGLSKDEVERFMAEFENGIRQGFMTKIEFTTSKNSYSKEALKAKASFQALPVTCEVALVQAHGLFSPAVICSGQGMRKVAHHTRAFVAMTFDSVSTLHAAMASEIYSVPSGDNNQVYDFYVLVNGKLALLTEEGRVLTEKGIETLKNAEGQMREDVFVYRKLGTPSVTSTNGNMKQFMVVFKAANIPNLSIDTFAEYFGAGIYGELVTSLSSGLKKQKAYSQAGNRASASTPIKREGRALKAFAVYMGKWLVGGRDAMDGFSLVSSKYYAQLLSDCIDAEVSENAVRGIMAQVRPFSAKTLAQVVSQDEMAHLLLNPGSARLTAEDIVVINRNKVTDKEQKAFHNAMMNHSGPYMGKVVVLADMDAEEFFASGMPVDFFGDQNAVKASFDISKTSGLKVLDVSHEVSTLKLGAHTSAQMLSSAFCNNPIGSVGFLRNLCIKDLLNRVAAVTQVEETDCVLNPAMADRFDAIQLASQFNPRIKFDYLPIFRGLVNNLVKGINRDVHKLRFRIDGANLFMAPDLAGLFGIQVLKDGEAYSPLMNNNGITEAIGLKFPKIHAGEFAHIKFVSYEDYLARAKEVLSKQEFNIFKGLVSHTNNQTLVCPLDAEFVQRLAGADFDGDKMTIVTDKEFVAICRREDMLTVKIEEAVKALKAQTKAKLDTAMPVGFNRNADFVLYAIEQFIALGNEDVGRVTNMYSIFTDLLFKAREAIANGDANVMEEARKECVRILELIFGVKFACKTAYVTPFKLSVSKEGINVLHVSEDNWNDLIGRARECEGSLEDVVNICVDLLAVGRAVQEKTIDSAKTGELIRVFLREGLASIKLMCNTAGCVPEISIEWFKPMQAVQQAINEAAAKRSGFVGEVQSRRVKKAIATSSGGRHTVVYSHIGTNSFSMKRGEQGEVEIIKDYGTMMAEMLLQEAAEIVADLLSVPYILAAQGDDESGVKFWSDVVNGIFDTQERTVNPNFVRLSLDYVDILAEIIAVKEDYAAVTAKKIEEIQAIDSSLSSEEYDNAKRSIESSYADLYDTMSSQLRHFVKARLVSVTQLVRLCILANVAKDKEEILKTVNDISVVSRKTLTDGTIKLDEDLLRGNISSFIHVLLPQEFCYYISTLNGAVDTVRHTFFDDSHYIDGEYVEVVGGTLVNKDALNVFPMLETPAIDGNWKIVVREGETGLEMSTNDVLRAVCRKSIMEAKGRLVRFSLRNCQSEMAVAKMQAKVLTNKVTFVPCNKNLGLYDAVLVDGKVVGNFRCSVAKGVTLNHSWERSYLLPGGKRGTSYFEGEITSSTGIINAGGYIFFYGILENGSLVKDVELKERVLAARKADMPDPKDPDAAALPVGNPFEMAEDVSNENKSSDSGFDPFAYLGGAFDSAKDNAEGDSKKGEDTEVESQ